MAKVMSPGVLLIGSLPLKSSREVFTKVCGALPDRLHAVPDGECGEREWFVWWQRTRFPPEAIRLEFGGAPYSESERPTFTIDDIKPTGYDDAAIASYAEFVDLRKQGVIGPNVRFQVSLPAAMSTIIFFLKPEFKAEIEPLYEQRLDESFDRIIATIPHQDMVIQIDLASEVVALECELGRIQDPGLLPHFPSSQDGMVERLVRLFQRIPPTINTAFHFCYGDLNHKHFVEPLDTGLVVGFANKILDAVGKTHTVEWVHIPVPQDRTDPEYFEPLKQLRLDGTRLYLGLVHANDEEGTVERMKTASAVCPYPYGVATECGMGRTPVDQLDSILSISKNVSEPITEYVTKPVTAGHMNGDGPMPASL